MPFWETALGHTGDTPRPSMLEQMMHMAELIKPKKGLIKKLANRSDYYEALYFREKNEE